MHGRLLTYHGARGMYIINYNIIAYGADVRTSLNLILLYSCGAAPTCMTAQLQ